MSLTIFKRPSTGSIPLCFLVAIYLLAALNLPFFNDAFNVFGGFHAGFFGFALAVMFLITAGLVLVSASYVIKPALVLVILSGAVASYFTDTFGVIIDKEMLRNVAVTTPQEAGHLITPPFLLHVLFFGVLPSAFVLLVRVRHRPFIQMLAANTVVVTLLLLGCVGLALSNYAGISSNIRQHRDMMAKLTPFSPITSAISLGVSAYRDAGVVRVPIGLDARLGPVIAKSVRPVVTVIVAGETARAMNFSLNGYARETNPELKALGVVNFPQTTSCGTATAVSLPCMFSVYRKKDYSDRKARSTDTLMDVLHRAGIESVWWDNNTGSKGIADLVSFASVTRQKDSVFCRDGECLDEIFVAELDRKLAGVTRNTTIVLHQAGSHGPAYFQRYPDAFRRFMPDCRTAQLSDCSNEEILNAYDNTILYTDHNLAAVIRLLKKHEATVTGAMIYMSDHGESLGENGLYLHGAPYMFAPVQQTHVPFITWFSDSYAQVTGLSLACVQGIANAPASHDNLFHTVLGMMNVVTNVYDRSLDVLEPCRSQTTTAS
ncbi:phosphoethanolamine transferase [Ferranicluibacter rubi]|uniref:phosphoethanolamine transferase n=1 Tax=Ferranicluibacter rubi TaxID=2715133 RepID=UPI00248C2792|nr:phosphoethanolamine--lipid A transferase [Ferranicluibacter rubi]